MRVWEDLLSENDRRVLGNKPRARQWGELGANPALLIIDVQRGFVGEDRPIYEQQARYPFGCGDRGWAVVRHLQKLIPAARAAGIPIVYSRNLLRPEGGLADTLLPASPSNAEGPNSEIVREIAPARGDIVVEKTRPSIFFGTPASYVLYGKKIDTVLVTGDSTSGCVRATAIDAGNYSFKVAVIEECVFDRIELSHKAALFDMWFKYCDVISLDETYQYINRIQKNR